MALFSMKWKHKELSEKKDIEELIFKHNTKCKFAKTMLK